MFRSQDLKFGKINLRLFYKCIVKFYKIKELIQNY